MVEPFLADPRIRYTRLERNVGLGAALNAGTAMVQGRYLAYLPSDDLYYPEHISSLVSILANHPEVYLALGDLIDPARTAILDGDLPKAEWFGDEWAPKLSEIDGQIYTVLPGRPLGLAPFSEIARAGINVHLSAADCRRARCGAALHRLGRPGGAAARSAPPRRADGEHARRAPRL